jgi:hypothetical protein
MRPSRSRLVASLLALVVVLALAAAATAQADTTPIGSGDLPSAVTDQDGVTHVAWLVGHGAPYSSADTIMYCQIPRGAVTCASTRELTPTCAGGVPAPSYHRVAGGTLDGNGPKVQITPFGDVYIIVDGICPVSFASTRDPWRTYRGVMRQLIFHSTDDGATFPPSEEGYVHVDDWKTFSGSPDETIDMASIYDAADNRIVSVEDGARDGNQDPGIYVLGRQDQIVFHDPQAPDMTQPLLGELAPNYINNITHSSYPVSLVQRGRGSFVVAYNGGFDATGRVYSGIYLKTFDQPTATLNAISDASNWSAEIPFPPTDDNTGPVQRGPVQPQLVSGPRGTFVFYMNADQNGAGTQRFYVREVTGNTLGPRHLVLTQPELRGGATGVVVTFNENRSTGRLTGVLTTSPTDAALPITIYTTSDDGGATWTAAQQIATYPRNADNPGNPYAQGTDVLTLANGDDGFTGLLLRTGTPPDANNSTNRVIYADRLPGSGTLDGGGTVPDGGGGSNGGGGSTGGGGGSGGGGGAGGGGGGGGSSAPTDLCRIKQFGPLDILADACFEIDRATGAVTAKGGVSVNGLRLAGAGITFDARARTVRSSGPVTFSIGDTNLFKTTIDWRLPAGNSFTLPGLDIGSLGGRLEGFPVTGSADVQLVRGGVQIPLHVGLPKVFGGLTGDVTLRADNLSGIHIRDIHIKANLGAIGPLTLSNLEFTYNPDDHRWGGAATIVLPPKPPGPALASQIGFADGDLEYLRNELTFPGEGIPIDTFDAVHITRIRFSLDTRPDLKLSGGATFTAGPKFGEVRVAEINGDFTFLFPDGRPATLRADGTLNLLNIPVANAYLQYRTDGLISFGGSVGLDVFDILQVHGSVDGWIMPPKTFSVDGKVRVCVGDLGCDGGEVGVSSKGFAACVSIAGADVGVGYEWGPSILWAPAWLSDLDIMLRGCSVGDYLVAAKPAQVGGARAIRVPDGLPFAVFRLTGTTAAPHVTLTSPNGQRIDVPADRASQSSTLGIVHVPSKDLTLVVVHRPAGGSWQIAPAADSSPLASAGVAQGLPEPSVHAQVTGKGTRRALSYNIKKLPGQKVRFEERAPGAKAAASLGYAKGTKGRIRFAPASGPRGRRTIVALVESYGTPRATLKVASYTAPAPARPATPKGLRVTRKGTTLTVSWKRVSPGISRYRLIVRLGDGRSVLLLPTARQTRATVPGVAAAVGATAALRAERADGTAGATASVRLAAVRAKAKARARAKPRAGKKR